VSKHGGKGHKGQYHEPAVTALAVLAFLGAGYTHKSGKYKDNVERAVKWLRAKQLPCGGWVRAGSGMEIYDHTMATLAMAEAYGMSKDPALRKPAQKGIDYVLKQQVRYKGWRHGRWHSTSVMGWAVMALKSARLAGLKVDAAGFQGATNRLSEVTDPRSGKVGYSRRGFYPDSKGFVTTSVGMVCAQFMGTPNTDPIMKKQADLLLKLPPRWKKNCGHRSDVQFFYHWYYGTLGMFQMGGEPWKQWNAALKKTLLPNQRKGGDADGSWDPTSGWAPVGGRVYSTAVGALILEVYYRYLPMYTK